LAKKKFDPFGEFEDDSYISGELTQEELSTFVYHDRSVRKNAADRRKRDILNEVQVAEPLTEEQIARKEYYKTDYIQAHKDLFPSSTGQRDFGEDQQIAIKRFQRIVQSRGKLIQLEPRGFAKTSRAVNQALLAILQGYIQFGLIVSSETSKSEDIMEQIQSELMGNDELMELYPGTIQCFRELDGKAIRANAQTYLGEPTNIGWSKELIRFPTIPGEPSSGAILLVRTKDNLRGISRKIRYGPEKGKVIRPDFVLLDDIQTDKDARSEILSSQICNNIKRSVLFGGSHSKKVRAIITITPNKRGDVAHHFVLKEPSWEVAQYSMLKKMPTHMDLWDEFGRILLNFNKFQEGDRERAQRRAKEFVVNNYEKLHEGAEVSWEEAYEWDSDDPVEVSALHHAMIFYYEEGEEAFNYECQCKIDKDVEEEATIKATTEQITSRISHLPRKKVPVQCTHIVTHIDCNQDILTYMTVASPTQLYPYIIDYGTYPKQKTDTWKKDKVQTKLCDLYPDIPREDVATLLYVAVSDLSEVLAKEQYEREDTNNLLNRFIGIDTRWHVDTLVRAIRESSVRPFLLPTQGLFYGEKDKPMMEQTNLDHDLHYHCYTGVSTDRTVSMLKIDVNSLKTLVHRGFIARHGTIGSIKWFIPETISGHLLAAQHIVSEDPEQKVNMKANRIITEWHHDGYRDNEFFDNLVGCVAILFKLGCTLKLKKEIKTMNMQEYMNQQKGLGN